MKSQALRVQLTLKSSSDSKIAFASGSSKIMVALSVPRLKVFCLYLSKRAFLLSIVFASTGFKSKKTTAGTGVNLTVPFENAQSIGYLVKFDIVAMSSGYVRV